MNVQPAHISQVVLAEDGEWVEISSDVCGVAADLHEIDPRLGVRFSKTGEFFAVFYRPDEQTTELVLTQKAYQGPTGAWLGLDQRIVNRIRQIGSSSYDFAAEVQAQNERAEQAKNERQQQILTSASEKARFEIRKAFGSKQRAFIGRGV